MRHKPNALKKVHFYRKHLQTKWTTSKWSELLTYAGRIILWNLQNLYFLRKMRQKPNALKIVPLYRKLLQTKSTTSKRSELLTYAKFQWKHANRPNNYGNVFCEAASQICPTHNFTKIQDRPTPSLILPLGCCPRKDLSTPRLIL